MKKDSDKMAVGVDWRSHNAPGTLLGPEDIVLVGDECRNVSQVVKNGITEWFAISPRSKFVGSPVRDCGIGNFEFRRPPRDVALQYLTLWYGKSRPAGGSLEAKRAFEDLDRTLQAAIRHHGLDPDYFLS